MCQFRKIVASSEEGVVILKPDGSISYANPTAEFLLGSQADDLNHDVFGVLDTGEGLREINTLAKDGSLRIVELTLRSLPGEDVQIVTLRDITQFRQQIHRRDEFLALLGHELRNPLNAIKSGTELLGAPNTSDEAQARAREVIHRQFRHLERMLDDLLELTRISRGKLTLRKVPLELASVARDALQAVTPLMQQRGHTTQFQAEEGIWVMGDPTRLQQVVVNLLRNAAKYIPDNGNVELTIQKENNQAVLIVQDNGPGLAAELIPRIFEPFIQGQPTQGSQHSGLGIGLALVHSLIQMHLGEVECWNNIDQPGATFVARLPLTDQRPTSQTSAKEIEVTPKKIALVEDNPDGRDLMKLWLSSQGHEVFEAKDGPTGVQLLAKCQPDVGLIDIGLPGFDGLELVRRAKERDLIDPKCRLIALTGYGSDEDIRRAREVGFHAHMTKPVKFDELVRLLAEEAVPVQESENR